MTTLRATITIAAGAALGCGAGILILNLGTFQAGIWLALAALLVIVRECVSYVQRRQWRRGREATWRRRIETGLAGARPALPNRRLP
jgi:hypothetical protein